MKRTLIACCILVTACKTAMYTIESSEDPSTNKLLELMQSNPGLQPFTRASDSLNIQVIYTQIDRDEHNQPHFTDYTFKLNPGSYFYPASTVKMPVAFLAVEKLNDLGAKGIDKFTTMVTDSNFTGQQVAYTQPAAIDSKASLAHYIRQIFLVSDNDAFNRLYEFLGQEYLFNELQHKCYHHSVVRHRLAIVLTPEQNRHTNAVSFHDTSGNLLYLQPPQYSNAVFPEQQVTLGKGYFSGGRLVNEPFDFSLKNNIALTDLHQQLRSLVFPQSVPKSQRYRISEADRHFLLRWMSSYPRESRYPWYDSTEYPDTYAKFLARDILPSSSLRVFSKSGWAYGFLTDVAYFADPDRHIEFMLSATILCNADGIFNDDHYDFEQTGYPFMRLLGRTIFDYELKRQRKHVPNLDDFHFDYTTE